MNRVSLIIALLIFLSRTSQSRADYDPIKQTIQTGRANSFPVNTSLTKTGAEVNWTVIGPEGARLQTFATTMCGDTVFLANCSGHLFLSTNRGRQWSQRMIKTSLYPSMPALEFIHFSYGVLYIATDLGLYKSNDFGETWQELITAIEVGFHAIYVDKDDPEILYAATYGENPTFGGFIKSTDGGATWNRFNNGLPSTSIYKLLRSPHNSRLFYAYTGHGMFKTENAGETWAAANGDLPPEQTLACAVDPTDSNRIYLGAFSGLYISNNQGEHWREITPPSTTPEIRAIAAGRDSLLLAGTKYGLFKSRNNGGAWCNTSTGLLNLSITDIKIVNDSLVYLSTMEGFYVSENAGESWERRMTGVTAFSCLDLCLGENRLFFGTAGAGIYSYAEGQWRDEGLDDSFYLMNRMSWSPQNRSLYAAYISTYDLTQGRSRSGVLVYSPGAVDSLTNIPMNDIYVTAAAPSRFEPNTLFIGAFDGVYQSIDHGISRLHAEGLRNQYIYSIAPSPFSANIVFATANSSRDIEESKKGVFKSKDTGYNFLYTCELAKQWIRFPVDLCFHPQNPEVMYASNSSGGVIYSFDGGDNWNVRDKLQTGEPFSVNAVCCHPQIDDRVYAGGNALYISEDAGLSWQMLAELPDGAGRITALVIDPHNPQEIYAGTTASSVLQFHHWPTQVVEKTEQPTDFRLLHNYPNPFNGSTRIQFTLPQSSAVNISIFDTNGKKIKTLVDRSCTAGEHSVLWDGANDQGKTVASGVYFYRLVSGEFSASQKMTLLR